MRLISSILIAWLFQAFLISTHQRNFVAAPSMGVETIGNRPLNAMNYKAWKNILPVANHKSRVYHSWVNGDERFYYQADIELVNQLLAHFVQIEQPIHEIVILPGPGSVSNFDGDQIFKFNCEMHLVGGIAQLQSSTDKGSLFWPVHPRLTIRADDQFDLEALEIPNNCQLVSADEMKRRYNEGLSSSDRTTRGWGMSFLARLDPYDCESLNTIAQRFDDPDPWVALCAIGVVQFFGPDAQNLLPRLETIANGGSNSLAEAAQNAIQSIKAASGAEQIESRQRELHRFQNRLKIIERFMDQQSVRPPR